MGTYRDHVKHSVSILLNETSKPIGLSSVFWEGQQTGFSTRHARNNLYLRFLVFCDSFTSKVHEGKRSDLAGSNEICKTHVSISWHSC